jgi:hypothetical protein
MHRLGKKNPVTFLEIAGNNISVLFEPKIDLLCFFLNGRFLAGQTFLEHRALQQKARKEDEKYNTDDLVVA